MSVQFRAVPALSASPIVPYYKWTLVLHLRQSQLDMTMSICDAALISRSNWESFIKNNRKMFGAHGTVLESTSTHVNVILQFLHPNIMPIRVPKNEFHSQLMTALDQAEKDGFVIGC